MKPSIYTPINTHTHYTKPQFNSKIHHPHSHRGGLYFRGWVGFRGFAISNPSTGDFLRLACSCVDCFPLWCCGALGLKGLPVLGCGLCGVMAWWGLLDGLLCCLVGFVCWVGGCVVGGVKVLTSL